MSDDRTLVESNFLSELPADIARRVASAFRSRKYPAGSFIFREGEVVDDVFVVASGEVALEMVVPTRGRQRILSLGPGDLLGWSPLLGSGAMSATAIALNETELFSASAEELRLLFESDYDVGYYFMREVARSLAKRLLATRLQMLDVFHQDAADEAK
jgi:CRP-like cAMP-binding protein